jgi:hypothetical protein
MCAVVGPPEGRQPRDPRWAIALPEKLKAPPMSVDCVDLNVRSERNLLRDPRDGRLKRIGGPSSLVLFGVTGDLARKRSCLPCTTSPAAVCCRRVSRWWALAVVIGGTSGVTPLGRVLTLVVATCSGFEDEAIDAANEASCEHPCRIVVLADGGASDPNRLDAQIRMGADVGASEVIILRGYGEIAAEGESLVAGLLLPDAPIVVWWPRGTEERQ